MLAGSGIRPFTRRLPLLLAIILAILLGRAASIHAAGGNALDRIDFGNPASEAAHGFDVGYASMPAVGTGALGQTFRAPLNQASGSNGLPVAGSDQELAFTITVDPAKQNYLTVRVWGSDTFGAPIYFKGHSPVGDPELVMAPSSPAFPNRFYYATEAIPLAMTQGKSSIQLVIYETNFSYQPGRPIYSAYTHTDPYFIPDGNDPTGAPIPQIGQLSPTVPLTKAQVCALLQAKRQYIYGSGGYYDSILARQVTPGTAGAPPEVIGLDLYNHTAATFNGTPDQWRDACGSGQHGPGYSTIPDEMLSVLTATYSLPPFTDANDNVVAGLDHYHDASIIGRIVNCLDSCTYLQSTDGHYQYLPDGAWEGLTSTPRATGHALAGLTTRSNGWSISLEGADTDCIGRAIIQLLNDPTAAPIFKNYLGQTIDADLNGGSMTRARAYERMLNNSINFTYSTFSVGTVSQAMLSMNSTYINGVALAKLEALFPYGSTDSTFPSSTTYPGSTYTMPYPFVAPAKAVDLIQQMMGATVATSDMTNGYLAGYTNYEISVGGFGEVKGVLSCGYDGRYGTILPWMANNIAAYAALDPLVNSTVLESLRTQARRASDGYLHFIYPNENYNGVTNGFTLAQEDFITYRDPYTTNANCYGFTVATGYQGSDPNIGINGALQRRGSYLEALYNFAPGDGKGGNSQTLYLAALGSYEATLRGLIGVDPATLTPLPGEPGAPNSAFVDPQTGTTAIYYNGERLLMNNNWRNTDYANGQLGIASNVSRIHDTTSTVDRAATTYMPHDSSTVQSDGNLSGGINQSWVMRYGPWIVAGNPTTSAGTIKLPPGSGVARDLVSGNTYNLGSSAPLPAGGTLALHLPIPAVSQPIPNGTYALSNAASKLLLDCPGGSAASGLQIDQAAPPASLNSQWVFTYNNGSYTVKNAASGLYLTGSASPGAPLVQQPANGQASQNWQLIPNGGGYELTNQIGGPVAGDPGASLNPGTGMVMAAQDESAGTCWLFQPVTATAPVQPLVDGIYTVTNVAGGQLITNPGSSKSSGQVLMVAAPTFGADQQWIFKANGNGFYTIRNAASGLYLTPVAHSGDFYYPQLKQVAATGTDWQLWAVFQSGRGLSLSNKATADMIQGSGGLSMDLKHGTDQFAWLIQPAGVPAPAAPTNLTAAANSTVATLNWTASPGATGYNVRRSTTSGSGYVLLAGNVTALTYTDTGLTNGTTYYYVVSAVSTGGESANSAEASATPAPAPGAPTALTATGGNAQAALTWTAPTGATGYNVKRGLTPGGPYATIFSGLTGTSYTDITPANGSTYYYVVTALGSGGESGNSNEANAFVSNPTTTLPTGVSKADVGTVVTAGSTTYLGGQTFTLNGAGAGITGTADAFHFAYGSTTSTSYSVIARVTTPLTGTAKAALLMRRDAPSAATGTSRTVGVILEPNGTACQARFVYRTSIAGTMTTGATSASLTVPQWLKITRSGNSYAGYVSTDGVTWTQVGTTLNTTALGTGTTYAGLAVTSGTTSSTASATFDNVSLPGLTVPAAPVLTAAASSTTQINLSWTAVTGAASYQLFRATSPNGPYTQIVSQSGTTYSDTNLSPGTSYYYSVRATGGGTISADSTVTPSTVLTTAPTSLTATAATSAAVLNWSGVSGATSYHVKRSFTNGSGYATVATVSGTSYTDNGLSVGATYYYVVTAVDAGGDSANSPGASVVPLTPNLTPLNVTAVGADQAVGIFWFPAAGATSYNVKRSTTSGSGFNTVASGVTASGYLDGNVTAGTVYYYKVSAVNGSGESADSATVSASTTPATIVTLPAIAAQDGYIQSASAANNAGGTTYSTTTPGRLGDDSGNRQLKAILAFDTSALPANAAVNAATLRWRRAGLVGTASPFSVLGPCYADLKAGSGFSNNPTLEATDFTADPDAAQVAAMSNPANDGDWSSGALAPASLGLLKQPTAAQFRLYFSTPSNGDSADNYLTWFTGEAAAANQPALDVTYNSGPAPVGQTLANRALGGYATASSQNSNNGEGAAQAFDGISAGGTTKWNTTVNGTPAWVQDQFAYGSVWTVVRYDLTSANDTPERDPKDWQLLASNDGINWTVLDTRQGETFAGRGLTKSYSIANNNVRYAYHRLNVTANAGGSGYSVQLAELTLMAYDLPAPTASVSAARGSGQLAVRWTAVDGAVGYNVKAGTNPAGPFVTLASVTGTSYVHYGLPDGATYYYVVSAITPDGVGNNSAPAGATTYSALERWRLANFGTVNPTGNAADNADPDGDGMTNLQEFAAGTNPNDPNSVFRITALQANGADMTVSFPTVYGKTYRAEYSDTLQAGSWLTVLTNGVPQNNIPGTGGTVQITDTGGASRAARFYHLVLVP